LTPGVALRILIFFLISSTPLNNTIPIPSEPSGSLANQKPSWTFYMKYVSLSSYSGVSRSKTYVSAWNDVESKL